MIRFTKAKAVRKAKPQIGGGKKNTLHKLYSFLNTAEPEAIQFLVSFWNTQARGVTYAELREAYLAGEITPQLYQRWTEDYSRFIQKQLAPLWDQAMRAGAAEVSAKYPHFVYEPSIGAAMGFIKAHGAELVTNITEEQRRALNAIISHVSGYTSITPDEAARIIRPTVGLTVGQTLANARHRQAVEAAYLKAHPKCNPKTAKRKAEESAARYAGRQHRYRAQNIARTELAFAYNAGHYGATKDAQAQGYIGDCVKVWLTAYDERVCPICSQMDDEKRNMDEPFSNGKLLPPAHPSCRCAVAYEEIPGTNLNPGMDSAPQQGVPSGAMGDYIRTDGSFDLDTALADYEKFLQSVPEKNRILLQAALDGATFERTDLELIVFGYLPFDRMIRGKMYSGDTVYYNSGHPKFFMYDFLTAMTHELGHRIDNTMFIQSWKNAVFSNAIVNARTVMDVEPQKFLAFAKSDSYGFLSDILSAICEDDYRFDAFHEKTYWLISGNKEKEIFANLFSLETQGDETSLRFFRENFPEIWSEYSAFWN